MNFKFAFAASALMAFAGIFTTVGCGGNACEQAVDHFAECVGAASGTGSATGSAACEGTALCSADCLNAADCDAIKDAFSGMPTDKSKSFLECSSKCLTTK